MGHGMRIAVLGAVVVGSVGGGLAAWFSSPGPAAPSTAAPAIAAPTPPTPPSAAPSAVPPAPAAPDPQAVVATQMRRVLARFAAWSRVHAGAPCPDGAALGLATLDPWGHPIALTCTDQPADQMVGAISGGADGVVGNDDDVASWTLGRDVTDLVRGARWKSARAATPPPRATSAQHTTGRPAAHDHTPVAPAMPPATTKPRTTPIDAGADDIPARR